MTLTDSGQFRLAIDTQASEVMLPMPCEITKAGGTIIDKGLIVDPKVIFIACTAKRREIIKIICLEVIVGLSFLETNINIPQLTRTSVKFKSQERISDAFNGEKSSSL